MDPGIFHFSEHETVPSRDLLDDSRGLWENSLVSMTWTKSQITSDSEYGPWPLQENIRCFACWADPVWSQSSLLRDRTTRDRYVPTPPPPPPTPSPTPHPSPNPPPTRALTPHGHPSPSCTPTPPPPPPLAKWERRYNPTPHPYHWSQGRGGHGLCRDQCWIGMPLGDTPFSTRKWLRSQKTRPHWRSDQMYDLQTWSPG